MVAAGRVLPSCKIVVVVLALVASLVAAGGAAEAQPGSPRQLENHGEQMKAAAMTTANENGAIITNGTLSMGIDRAGNVDYNGVGLRFEETGGDALIPGCWCEGWGIGDTARGVLGWASASNPPSRLRGTVQSFTATADSARSVVLVDGALEVVHDFTPARTRNLYAMTLTVTNTSAMTLRPTYRRAMDWDVPPQEFYEYVTIAGDHSALLASTNDGFASLDVRRPPTDLGARGTFEDFGPDDHGALFDFDLGELAPGASVELQMFYGAAASENRALDAVEAVDGVLWSFGQPPSGSGSADGTPNTFIFTVAESGLRFRPQPADVYVGLEARLNPVGGAEVAHLGGKTFRAAVVDGPSAGARDECRFGTLLFLWGCSGRFGGLTFTAGVPGVATLDGYIDVNDDGNADPNEPSTRGRITWLEGIDAVGLGDSFSSGQGAGDYDKELEVCERSSRAYARVLRAPNDTLISTMSEEGVRDASFAFIACGGARSFHVKRAVDGGIAQHPDAPPQLDQGEVRASTDLVTVTIGGNDLGFSDVVAFCATKNCATEPEYKDGLSLEAWGLARLEALGPELRDLYAQIRRQSGAATVVVAGYPYLYPRTKAEQSCVKLQPFNSDEQNLIRRLQDTFDATLAELSAEAGVHFVSVLEHFDQHEICGEEGAWMNAIRPAWKWPPVSGESFHPNAEGQRQYAEKIRRELVNRVGEDPAPTGLPRNPAPVARASLRTASASAPTLSEPARFGVAVVSGQGGDSCGVYIPGDRVDYAVGDLAPRTSGTIALEAGGSVLASFTTDEHGRAAGSLTLPQGVSADALLVLSGTSVIGGAARSFAVVPVAAARPACASTAPSVQITTPADGAMYGIDERIAADYRCAASELTVCLGDLPLGDPLPTTPGAHRFSVIAQDAEGESTVVTHRYTMGAGLSVAGPGTDVPAGTSARFTVTRTGPWDAAEPLPFRYRVEGGVTAEGLIPAGADRALLELPTSVPGTLTVALLDAAHHWLAAPTTATATVVAGGVEPWPPACDTAPFPPPVCSPPGSWPPACNVAASPSVPGAEASADKGPRRPLPPCPTASEVQPPGRASGASAATTP